MKARGAAVQGTLALLGLAAAYATWQRPGDKATGGDVVVFDLARSDLERVRYEDGPKLIELERREDGTERGLWLHLATREAAGDRDAVGADAGFSGATSDRSGDAGVVAERADGGTLRRLERRSYRTARSVRMTPPRSFSIASPRFGPPAPWACSMMRNAASWAWKAQESGWRYLRAAAGTRPTSWRSRHSVRALLTCKAIRTNACTC